MSRRLYEQRDGSTTAADGFGYDANSELTSFIRDGTLSGSTVTGTTTNTHTLVYDASGNRKTTVDNGTTTSYTPNNLNQYATVTGLANPTYDGNGNLKTYNGWIYTYDAMNRLTSAVKGTASANFWYDGFNRICTWQENGSGFARFNVYDGWDLVEEYQASNVLDTEYLHGAGSDELVSMKRGGQTYYLFQDGRGNTSQVVDSNGALVETTKYDVHGAPTTTVASGHVATGNRFLFTGREYFPVSGLYNYRNRFYLPSAGRFLQPDPVGFAGDPANLYRYCGNNPVNASDPMGLDVETGTHPAGIFPHYYIGVTDAASGGGLRWFDFSPKDNATGAFWYAAGHWDDTMTRPTNFSRSGYSHATPEQDLVILNALYQPKENPSFYSVVLCAECQNRAQGVLRDALGTERFNFDPVNHYTGNISDAQGNWVGWENPDTGNIYNADGKWAGYNPDFRKTFGNTWGSFRVGLSSGEASYLGFQGADGFGGGGGLGPPGGLEQAVWDNMHKKKDGQ